ncbi:MAG TPA: cytochrome c biogenesis CcdA family protein [Kouleothrix sp.]|uniref:cytochrome c biogenesis CcdA family protein n=1 Tax=Kouleothrix sp. TaxID=2779161 RepID=UPI002C2B5C84|nr:cytochrome c biogenesis CcdA family protein [Kouleothrix sp.]HRC75980.1 cytochrome c biogenesis CcdA family protein [Kouleothrix sp.]
MAAPQLDTPARETAERAFPYRGLLIGLGVALALGAVALLSLRSAASGLTPAGSGSVLVLAPAAFLAGIFSFLSPCTLPILPAYFAFTFQARRERVVLMTIAFFLGLATTMVVLGASATALSQILFSYLGALTTIGGLIVIAFGVMSILGKGFTGAKLLDRPTASVAGSYLYGATFALGWTACVGPILGALLTLLATQGIAIVQGAVLAFIYALGLGMPLIIMATFFSRLGRGSRFWAFMRGRGVELNLGFTTLHLHTTSIASGVLLVIVGVLLATGQLTLLSQWSQQTRMGEWAVELEQGIERLFFGR